MDYSFCFKYKKDVIRVWPLTWILSFFGKSSDRSIYLSESYGEYFNHFSDYWQMVGKKSALLEVLQRQRGVLYKGSSWAEILAKYCTAKFHEKSVVVIFEVDASSLTRTLGKLQGLDLRVFQEDVVFFVFNTREEAMKLATAIPGSVGEVMVFSEGTYIPFEVGFSGWDNV